MAESSMDAIDAAAGAGEGLFLRKATGLVRDISSHGCLPLQRRGHERRFGGPVHAAAGAGVLPEREHGRRGHHRDATHGVLDPVGVQRVLRRDAALRRRLRLTSRTIHPFVGWILGWNQAIWLIFFWIGFNAWALCQFTLPPTLQILAQTTGIHGLGRSRHDDRFAGRHVRGRLDRERRFAYLVLSRRIWGWQKVTVVFAFAAVIIPALLAVISGPSGMQTAWDGFVAGQGSGLTYDQIIPKAQKLGYPQPYERLRPERHAPHAAVGVLRRRLRRRPGADQRRDQARRPVDVVRPLRLDPLQRLHARGRHLLSWSRASGRTGSSRSASWRRTTPTSSASPPVSTSSARSSAARSWR